MLSGNLSKRGALVVLILAAFATPVIFMLAGRAIRSNHNDASDWLPSSYAETRQLEWFRQHFVADQFVVISWEGCRLGSGDTVGNDDPRIARLALALREAEWLPNAGGTAFRSILPRVFTGNLDGKNRVHI